MEMDGNAKVLRPKSPENTCPAWKKDVWEGSMPVGPEGMNQSTMEVLGFRTLEVRGATCQTKV